MESKVLASRDKNLIAPVRIHNQSVCEFFYARKATGVLILGGSYVAN